MGYKPFNSDLGQRIYDDVSQQAWMLWVELSKYQPIKYTL